MKKTVLLLMLIAVCSKLLGFARDIILSYYYGASGISDAYIISITIPTIIFSFIGTGIATSYIPIYSSIIKEKGSLAADRFTNNIINIIIILCTFILIISLIFTTPIVKLFASGFQGSTLDLAIDFTRIGIVGVYFYGLIYIFNGYLQLKDNYLGPALRGIPLNLCIIASVILSANYGTSILAIGSVVAVIVQLFFLIPLAYKKGFKYNIVLDFKDEHVKKMIFLSIPVIIGVSVNQINVLVDRTIASQIALGGISALTYATRLTQFIQGIFVESIATVLYPKISKMASEKNWDSLKKHLLEAICGINLLVIPSIVGTMIFSEPIVKLLFGRGAFNTHDALMTSNALFYFSLGMIGFGLREVLARAFYAMHDTKTPLINAAIALVINIILNIVLSKYMGLGGLALATSISSIICTALLFTSLRKKMGSLKIGSAFYSILKIIAVSLIMGIVSKIAYNLLILSFIPITALFIAILVALIIYLSLISFMKINEVNIIIASLRKK